MCLLTFFIAFLHLVRSWGVSLAHFSAFGRAKSQTMNERNKELSSLCYLVSAKSTHNPLASSTSLVERTKKQRHDQAQTSDGSHYKEAVFLCIPVALYCHRFHCQRITASDVTVDVLDAPMFNHRVLPLPPLLTSTTLPSPLTASPTTRLPSVNMPSHGLGSTEVVSTRRASLRSSSPKRNHYPTRYEKASSEASKESALVLHPSTSASHKRSVSEDSVEEVQRTVDSAYPSLASTGISTSEICLCQPDPKVPRPRNGKLPPYPYANLYRSSFAIPDNVLQCSILN